MSNLEELMHDLVRSSVDLKRKLYRRDEAASTTPEGTDGPRIEVHTCRLCNRSAGGNGAQVRHRSGCELAKLQRAQKVLREAWPELFAERPAPEEEGTRARCVAHPWSQPIERKCESWLK